MLVVDIEISFLLLTLISRLAIPIEVTTRIALPDGTLRTNDPSVVVAVAIEVPFTVTVAPDTGLPVSSVTFPDTLKLV